MFQGVDEKHKNNPPRRGKRPVRGPGRGKAGPRLFSMWSSHPKRTCGHLSPSDLQRVRSPPFGSKVHSRVSILLSHSIYPWPEAGWSPNQPERMAG